MYIVCLFYVRLVRIDNGGAIPYSSEAPPSGGFASIRRQAVLRSEGSYYIIIYHLINNTYILDTYPHGKGGVYKCSCQLFLHVYSIILSCLAALVDFFLIVTIIIRRWRGELGGEQRHPAWAHW